MDEKVHGATFVVKQIKKLKILCKLITGKHIKMGGVIQHNTSPTE